MRYSFELVLSVSEITEELTDAIYKLEIDSLLVGSRNGNVYIDCYVEGTSFNKSVKRLTDVVENALNGITVIYVNKAVY